MKFTSEYIKKLHNELYPNVKLNLTVWDEKDKNFDRHTESIKFQTQVMAGEAPAVFVTGGVADLYKTMQSGVYADLSSFFESDKNFNIDDFNKAIFCSGQMNGKQYMVPTSYRIPLFITTQAIVDETKLDLAVRYNSNNMQNAYNFIKLMISEELNSSQFMMNNLNALQSEEDIPINNKVVEEFFETYKGKEGDKDGFFAAGTSYKFEYVPDDLIEQYKGFLSEIDNVSLGSEIAYTMRGIMQPFLEGEKTYEECIEKAQGMLEIYMTE